jgi:hypothetical protein
MEVLFNTHPSHSTELRDKMPQTYESIASVTVPTNIETVTFLSIPSTYTDLVLVVNAKSPNATGNNPVFRINIDTVGNYGYLYVSGNGTSTGTGLLSSSSTGVLGLRSQSLSNVDFTYNSITHFMNYSNNTTYKTVLSRSNDATLGTEFGATTWRSTATINRIECLEFAGGAWAAGSTLTLYGIKAA